MNCKQIRENIYKFVDEEIRDGGFARHLIGCPACQKKVESVREFNALLKTAKLEIDPSKNFENTFWAKVLERQQNSWLERLLGDLEAVTQFVHLKQATAFILLAFLIGNIGGATTVMIQKPRTTDPLVTSSHGIAFSYLKTMDKGISS